VEVMVAEHPLGNPDPASTGHHLGGMVRI
jgi:hypothetical protein